MNQDRRQYERWYRHIQAVLFDQDSDAEAKCFVKDISEFGISFVMIEAAECPFHKDETITFQFFDEFPAGPTEESFIITETAVIRHLEKEQGRWQIGCYLDSARFREYVVKCEAAADYIILARNVT